MIKQLLLLFLLAFPILSAHAEISYQKAGTHNMHIRVENNYRYLLLPVSDNGPEYRVQIIENNQLYRSLMIRLAAEGQIDTYVPLGLQGLDLDAMHLNVRVMESSQLGGVVDSMPLGVIAWDSIQAVNTFDVSNTDYYRPVFHHTPLYGWMNDPNGMFYDSTKGVWHLYYQHNPYGSKWQNMTWGHSTSTDLLHWEHQPLAIELDAIGAIFSGSCVIDTHNSAGFGENAVIAFYTSAGESQTQSIAYSLDGGLTFTKYAGNPILVSDIPDFRDPKVWWNETSNEWNMVLACGQEMRFYASSNLKNWTYLSSFGKDYGCHGGVWECPDMMRLPVRGTEEEKWVLLCNINPGGPFGGSATQYFVGDWDGKQFVPLQEKTDSGVDTIFTKWMDYGKDHYATVSFAHAPQNRHTVLVWMSNWQYANDVPTQQFRSANALPRDIDLYVDDAGIYRMGVVASPEVANLKGDRVKAGNSRKRPLPSTALIEVEVTSANQPATITLRNEKDESVVMTYDFQAGTFTMNRTSSGITDFSRDFAAATTTPLFVGAKKHRLTIYVDKCSIEAFDAEGHWAMTNLVFPTIPYNQVEVVGGKANVYSIK